VAVKRSPRPFVLAVGTATAVYSSACSNNTIAQPPELGDCYATADASCKLASAGPGGASLSHSAVDAGLDTGLDAVTVTADGGSCGQADLLISASTQNLACLPCIVGAPPSGCCPSDTDCSNDPGCRAIVQCALSCNGSTACVGMCEALSTQLSVVNYNALGSCLGRYCSPQCPSLPVGTAGDL
jgi:hypothetical protein